MLLPMSVVAGRFGRRSKAALGHRGGITRASTVLGCASILRLYQRTQHVGIESVSRETELPVTRPIPPPSRLAWKHAVSPSERSTRYVLVTIARCLSCASPTNPARRALTILFMPSTRSSRLASPGTGPVYASTESRNFSRNSPARTSRLVSRETVLQLHNNLEARKMLPGLPTPGAANRREHCPDVNAA